MVNFKIFYAAIWEITVAINILPNVSRSKEYHTAMKFGQPVVCYMRHMFPEKSSYATGSGEIIPKCYSLFLLYSKLRAIKIC